MNFKQTQKQAALEAEYRHHIIDSAVDMFDIVTEVGKRIYDNAVSTGSHIKTPDRAEAFKLVELALKAEEIKALSRIETSVDNV